MKPFMLPEPIFIDVHDMKTARTWYEEKLACRAVLTEPEERTIEFEFDVGESHLVLTELSTEEKGPGGLAYPPILFTRKISQTRDWMSSRGIAVGPIQTNRAEQKFFRFWDLEGNELEVCEDVS